MPAGLFITLSVSMITLIIYGLELFLKTTFPENRWILPEIGTVVAGLVALWFFPFPFLLVQIYIAGWNLAVDLTRHLFGKETVSQQQHWVSILVGLLMIGISYVLQMKNKKAYAFWGYLLGTLSFWLGVTSQIWQYQNEGLYAGYVVLNIFMMVIAILLKEKIFLVLGAFGYFIYLSHLAYDIFENSMLFPLALSALDLH